MNYFLKDKTFYYGVGLNVDKNFENFMHPFIQCFVNVELDPFYFKSEEDVHVLFENDTFNAAITTEIFEHLVSPFEMISEGSRILKKAEHSC